MNTRRGFLAALIGAAVLDPERLLWVPGKKLISIPKPVVKAAVAWTRIESSPIVFTFDCGPDTRIEFSENVVKVFGNWVHKDRAGNVDALFQQALLRKGAHEWT